MRLYLYIPLVLLLIAAGCSGTGDNPISPEQSNDYNPDAIPIIALSESGTSSNGLGIMGPYEISIDSQSLTAELVATRQVSLGESYLVNGLSYFTIAPCTDCLKITSIALTTEGYVEINFGLRHPFEVGNPEEPATGKNRSDLDLFDVAMVVVPKNVDPTLYTKINTLVYDNVCANADGYTRELQNVTQKNGACPFFLVVDDSTSEPGISTFNEFPMGGEASFSTYFNPKVNTTFDIYLTMGYGTSATFLTRFDPVYFNPEFNRKNAWKVEVIPPQGDNPPDVYNTWNALNTTTPQTITVKVWDWQHGVTTIVDPPVDPSDIKAASDVVGVSCEIPFMQTTHEYTDVPVSGTGLDPDNPLVFELQYRNANQRPTGVYTGLVKITDSRIPPTTAPGGTPDTLFHHPNPPTSLWKTIPEFATYQTFRATVVDAPCIYTSGSIIEPEGTLIDVGHTQYIDFIVEVEPLWGTVDNYWVDWGSGSFTESSQTGLFTHNFSDDVCSQVTAPPAAVGDLSVTVNRVTSPNGYKFDPSKPFTLSWTNPDPQPADLVSNVRFGVELSCDPGDIKQFDLITVNTVSCNDFVIYMDTDASDGLNNDMQPVSVSIEAQWDAPESMMEIDGSFYTQGVTFEVYSRSSMSILADNPSELAFISLTSAETATYGHAYNYEGWTANNRSGNEYHGYYPFIFGGYAASGTRSVRFGDLLGQASVGNWEGIAKPMPSVPSSTVRELTFSMFKYRPG